MQRTTQLRTLSALIMLILLASFNTLLAFGLELYSEPMAWVTYAVAAIVFFVVLRYQQRLTPGATTAVLALPFVVALIGVVLAL